MPYSITLSFFSLSISHELASTIDKPWTLEVSCSHCLVHLESAGSMNIPTILVIHSRVWPLLNKTRNKIIELDRLFIYLKCSQTCGLFGQIITWLLCYRIPIMKYDTSIMKPCYIRQVGRECPIYILDFVVCQVSCPCWCSCWHCHVRAT